MKAPLQEIGKAVFREIIARGWTISMACRRLGISRATAYRIKDDENWLPDGRTLQNILAGFGWDLYDLADRVATTRKDTMRGRPSEPAERLAEMLTDQMSEMEKRLRELEDGLGSGSSRGNSRESAAK